MTGEGSHLGRSPSFQVREHLGKYQGKEQGNGDTGLWDGGTRETGISDAGGRHASTYDDRTGGTVSTPSDQAMERQSNRMTGRVDEVTFLDGKGGGGFDSVLGMDSASPEFDGGEMMGDDDGEIPTLVGDESDDETNKRDGDAPVTTVSRSGADLMGNLEQHVLRLRGGGDGDSDLQSKNDDVESSQSFTAILKNCRSLSTEERLGEFCKELSDTAWDAILFNETWRAEKEEYDTLHNGHLWLGSGGAPGKHGVGILLHKRWAKYNPRWRVISSRLGVMELSVKQLKLTFAVVYMPHCGYKDESVHEMYSQLSSIVRDSRSRKRILIIAGDWNAEVESAGLDYERKDFVGRYANATGNNRGDWLKRWATSERLVVANTLFKKRWGLRWTHEQHGRRRHIDYILVDSKYRRLIKDAVVEKTLDLGSDHRAVKLILNITDFAIKSKLRRRAASKCMGWKPQAFAEYHRQLDERLADFQRTIDLEAHLRRWVGSVNSWIKS